MDSSYEIIKSLVSSRLRLDILSSLEVPMRLCNLKRAVKSNAPNTSSRAKDLQNLGLVKRDGGDYEITPAGRVINERINMLSDTVEAIYNNREFWERMLDKLPDEVISSIHEFREARVIKSSKNDLDKVKREILHLIRGAEKEIVVVLPMKCGCIRREVEKASKTVDTQLETLADNPELRYGMIKTNGTTILFTEMLDMALVKESCRSGILNPVFIP